VITEREVHRPSVEIPAVEALRYLGMASKGREPRESIRRMFEEELREAKELITPAGVLARFDGGLPGSAELVGEQPFHLCVCTIGAVLDRRVSELFAEGDGARGVILDAIGSAAVEAVVEWFDALVGERAKRVGLYPARRKSPGYAGWNITEQRLIFDALRPIESGVELNESCMMSPQKSVSFAITLSRAPVQDGWRSPCDDCDLESCTYRDTGECEEALSDG